MKENLFESLLKTLEKIPIDEAKIEFEKFLQSLEGDEKIIFLVEAIQYIDSEGDLPNFIKQVNESISEFHNDVMDDYLDGGITKEEMVEKMQGMTKISDKFGEDK